MFLGGLGAGGFVGGELCCGLFVFLFHFSFFIFLRIVRWRIASSGLLVARHLVYTADARGEVVAAGGEHVVEGDDERRGLHIAACIAFQVGSIPVLHVAEVHAYQVEVILAHLAYQLVDFAGTKVGVVALAVADGHPAGVGEVACQLLELLFAEAEEHLPHLLDAVADAGLHVAV